jgi:hypothetical protein
LLALFIALAVLANGNPIENIDEHDTIVCPDDVSNGCEWDLY